MSKIVNSEILLVFVDTLANSNKFWKAKANNNGDLEVTWGRVGYNGQTKVYSCGSYINAVYQLHTLANKKKQKGYREPVLDSKNLKEEQVHYALKLLEVIKRGRNDWNYTSTVNEYLSLVPTPLGTKIDPHTLLSSHLEISRHEQILQSLLVKENSELKSSEVTKVISLKGLSNLFWKVS